MDAPPGHGTAPPLAKLDHFDIYTTRQRLYVVGSDHLSKRAYVCKMDRTHANDLAIDEDSVGYTMEEMKDLLNMMQEANKSTGGLRKIASCYAILGFIRFVQGYYMLIVTKRKKVGFLAGHFVYSITEIDYLSVPNRVWRDNTTATVASTLDARYKELVQLSEFADCYFSYTFDLTHTVQHYYAAPKVDGGTLGWHDRFVWNRYLLEPLLSLGVSQRWVMPIIHGYFQQVVCHVADKPVAIALLGRRSRHFAGVRYLKRGITDEGHVANEVEVEQIVQSLAHGQVNAVQCISSFVQLRGSIPLYWGQDSHSMAPKPPIIITRTDPFYSSTVLHFANLFERYGGPLLVLNLVKSIEKVPRETILKEEYERCIMLLNESLDAENRIIYIPWDFLRAQKQKFDDPVALLDAIAEAVLAKTDIFMRRQMSSSSSSSSSCSVEARQQSGTVRTNCIDSLDRTNAGQFCVGKAALAHQLQALGLTSRPLDDEVQSLLMRVYEELGNHLSMQYGGSELAHTMKNFESKTWTSSVRDSSRELLTGMKRYYSNSFTDTEKQASMNLVLGIYVPLRELEDLWMLETDYLLHNRVAAPTAPLVFTTAWWSEPLRRFAEMNGNGDHQSAQHRLQQRRRRAFNEYYYAGKLTSFDKLLRNSFYVLPDAKPESEAVIPLLGSSARKAAPPSTPSGSRSLLRRNAFSSPHLSASSSSLAPAVSPAQPDPQGRKSQKMRAYYNAWLNPGTTLASRSCVPTSSVNFYVQHVTSLDSTLKVAATNCEVYSSSVKSAQPELTCGPVYPYPGSSAWQQGVDDVVDL